MKKIMLIILFSTFLVGCEATKIDTEVKILVPYGIPYIAVGELIDEDNVIVEAVSGPDLLTSGMVSKSSDIIIAPLNIGAKLYLNNSSIYQLDSIITFGNSYVVSRKSVSLNNISELNNKDILAYGKNATPDIILKKALATYDINTTINYQIGVEQVIPFFICNPDNPNDLSCNPPNYILSAEPIISKLEIEYNMELNIIDLQSILKSEIELIPQAAIFVNPNSENLESINKIIDLIEDNISYLNENPKEYASKIVNKHQYFQNLKAVIIEKSIPRSNIDFLKAIDNQDICNEFFDMLNTYNSNLLGGKTPDTEFYRS